jgi:MerR family mercuric resistance operon transcriptional regulator
MQPFTDARGAPLSIGVLSPLTGVQIETIGYYERVYMLAALPRTRGGRRAYGQSQRRALSFIRRARDLGFSLDEIRALLDLERSGRASCEEVREIASLHLGNVRAKLADLARRRRCYPRRLGGARPTFTRRVLCLRFWRPSMRLLQARIFASRESGSKMAVFGRSSKGPSVHSGVRFGVQL